MNGYDETIQELLKRSMLPNFLFDRNVIADRRPQLQMLKLETKCDQAGAR